MPVKIVNQYTGQPLRLGWKQTPAHRLVNIPKLSRYFVRSKAKEAPPPTDYASKAQRSLQTMLMNNQLGCCTISAVGHQAGVYSANRPSPQELVMTDQEVSRQYAEICGPGDRGCYIPDVLDHWRDRGIVINGKLTKIHGYALVDPADELLVRTAGYLFAALHVGFMLSRDQYQGARPGGKWTADNSPIVGGHSVCIPDVTEDGYKVSTWGMLLDAEREVFSSPRAQAEMYVILSDQWFDQEGLSTHGIRVEQLRADLDAIARGEVPDWSVDPPPEPDPEPEPEPKPGKLSATGYLDVLGIHFPIVLGGSVQAEKEFRAKAGGNWLRILADLARLVAAANAQDWVAVAAAVEQLLRDLGVVKSREELSRALKAIGTGGETAGLAGDFPESS